MTPLLLALALAAPGQCAGGRCAAPAAPPFRYAAPDYRAYGWYYPAPAPVYRSYAPTPAYYYHAVPAQPPAYWPVPGPARRP